MSTFNIIEEVTGPNYLAIWGKVAAVGTSGSFSGALDRALSWHEASILEPETRIRPRAAGQPPIAFSSRDDVGVNGFWPPARTFSIASPDHQRGTRRTLLVECRRAGPDEHRHRHARYDARRPVAVRRYMDASMPALERLAREGVVFDRALTVAPLTLPAHTRVYSPDSFRRATARQRRSGPPRRPNALAETLRAPARTGAFVSSVMLASDHEKTKDGTLEPVR